MKKEFERLNWVSSGNKNNFFFLWKIIEHFIINFSLITRNKWHCFIVIFDNDHDLRIASMRMWWNRIDKIRNSNKTCSFALLYSIFAFVASPSLIHSLHLFIHFVLIFIIIFFLLSFFGRVEWIAHLFIWRQWQANGDKLEERRQFTSIIIVWKWHGAHAANSAFIFFSFFRHKQIQRRRKVKQISPKRVRIPQNAQHESK